MEGVFIPIFLVCPTFIPIKAKLVHSECNQNVFRWPQFFIGIFVFHAYCLHYFSASRIIHVMRSRNIKDSDFFQPVSECLADFGTNSLMPATFAYAITQIMAISRPERAFSPLTSYSPCPRKSAIRRAPCSTRIRRRRDSRATSPSTTR